MRQLDVVVQVVTHSSSTDVLSQDGTVVGAVKSLFIVIVARRCIYTLKEVYQTAKIRNCSICQVLPFCNIPELMIRKR